LYFWTWFSVFLSKLVTHTILWWQLIFDYQFWSGQYCWNRYQRQCSIQTCLAFYQILLWLFEFHLFFKYFYCDFPSILTLGTQYPQNRDIWKRPVVRHLNMKSEHFWSPVWVLETKYTKWRNKITHSDWLCTRRRWSPAVPRKSMILEPFLCWSTFSEIE